MLDAVTHSRYRKGRQDWLMVTLAELRSVCRHASVPEISSQTDGEMVIADAIRWVPLD